MIDPEKAAELEARLAELLREPPHVVRDYLNNNVRAGDARPTGYRFVRGSHSGQYVRDPEGTDMLPVGHAPL